MLNYRKASGIIVITSICIPLVVAIIYLLPKSNLQANSYNFIPKLNAVINSVTTVILISAFMAVKFKEFKLHKQLMLTATSLSVLFLIGYLIYHSTNPSTHFGGEGASKLIYFILLISHILLAIVIVPLVLITLNRGLTKRFDKHRKIARWTLPIWLYVTISGVIVYLMIAPYYQ